MSIIHAQENNLSVIKFNDENVSFVTNIYLRQ